METASYLEGSTFLDDCRLLRQDGASRRIEDLELTRGAHPAPAGAVAAATRVVSVEGAAHVHQDDLGGVHLALLVVRRSGRHGVRELMRVRGGVEAAGRPLDVLEELAVEVPLDGQELLVLVGQELGEVGVGVSNGLARDGGAVDLQVEIGGLEASGGID